MQAQRANTFKRDRPDGSLRSKATSSKGVAIFFFGLAPFQDFNFPDFDFQDFKFSIFLLSRF
jgi:hypothetical protein